MATDDQKTEPPDSPARPVPGGATLATAAEPLPDGAERRVAHRLELGLAAHCQIDGAVSQESLGDLSSGGLYLRITRPIRMGAKVRVVLGLPYIGGQRVCSLGGVVVWLDREADGRQRGVGVQFDHDTDPADRELVDGFLALWSSHRADLGEGPASTSGAA